ncbi:hypothetical protein ACQSME_00600 [Streptomyces sp. 2-6]
MPSVPPPVAKRTLASCRIINLSSAFPVDPGAVRTVLTAMA